MTALRVTEIFYSIQGEGIRAGQPSVFVRLSGCSAKHLCLASGVECDTEFESGSDLTVDQIAEQCAALTKARPCIIWTGGEPLDQLTPDHLRTMVAHGWERHAVETSGIREFGPEIRTLVEWVSVSPKVAEHVLKRNFRHVWVDELRYVRSVGQSIPLPEIQHRNKCLSPHSDGDQINRANLRHCLDLCLAHPEWSFSLQLHKLAGIR